MSQTEVNIEQLNKEIKKNSELLLAKAIKARLNQNVKIRPRGSGAIPSEKDLNQLERGTYKQNLDVAGYYILTRSPTIIFYKSITDNTVIIAVRGSADTRDWLQTNTTLPFGGLTRTARYKEDKKFVGDNIGKYDNGNDIYVVGHSLGGVIADQLRRDFPIIKGGFTFNPAFQPQDYFRQSKVERKYTSRDPLGLLGRFLPGAKVENNETFFQRLIPTSILGRKDAHMLNAFESGKQGGKKVCMDKKVYVKEHKKLISLLDKAGKEGQEQRKELNNELKGGMIPEQGIKLHAVIIKNTPLLDDARKLAYEVTKRNDMTYRTTKTSIRFRNIPKTKFIPKTFRTKKINKNISLIYGQLK